MSYRIRYEVTKGAAENWFGMGVLLGAAVWATVRLSPVWSRVAAGEGLYDALARFVGGMILGPR